MAAMTNWKWIKNQSKWNKILFFFLLAVSAHILVGRVILIFSLNSSLGGSFEEVFAFYIQIILEGKTFYPDPSQHPYVISQYSPIFYHTAALLGKILQVDPNENVKMVFWAGRTVNLIANILTLAFLVKCIRLFRNVGITEVLAVFIVYFGTLTSHNIATRPDSMKTMFIVMGFFYLLLYQKNSILKHYALSAVLFSLAILSKQDALMEYSIILGIHYLLVSRNRIREVTITVIVFVLFAILMKLVFFDQHLGILFIKAKEMVSLEYGKFIMQVYRQRFWIYFTFIIIVVLVYLFETDKRRIRYLFVVYLFLAAYNTFTLGFFGSAFVYMSTSLILAILIMSAWSHGRSLVYVLSLFVVFFLIRNNSDYRSNIYHNKQYNAMYVHDHEVRKEVKQYLDNHMGDAEYVLTFDKLLTNYIQEYAVFPNYETEGLRFFYYGDIDLDTFNDIKKFHYDTQYLVEHKEPKYVVLHHEKQIDIVYESVNILDYVQVDSIENYRIFKHKYYMDEVVD